MQNNIIMSIFKGKILGVLFKSTQTIREKDQTSLLRENTTIDKMKKNQQL